MIFTTSGTQYSLLLQNGKDVLKFRKFESKVIGLQSIMSYFNKNRFEQKYFLSVF